MGRKEVDNMNSKSEAVRGELIQQEGFILMLSPGTFSARIQEIRKSLKFGNVDQKQIDQWKEEVETAQKYIDRQNQQFKDKYQDISSQLEDLKLIL